MSEDTEVDDAEVSDGASENDSSDHDHEPDVVDREEDDNTDMAEQRFRPDVDENGQAGESTATTTKPKPDQKDSLRPRRKKARRACFACQRAHLTCGDERPCQRCIKRGLADRCQDGVRKKAKYLHDAPVEALRPILGPNYNQMTKNRINTVPVASSSASDTSPGIGSFFSPADASPSYPIFTGQQNQMPPPLQSSLSYGSQQQSPLTPTFQNQVNRQPSMQVLVPQVTSQNDSQADFAGALFDPSNPALFEFDLEGLSFGNHYGALEFGMLGHMSSGAVETSPKDTTGPVSSQGMGDVTYNAGAFGSNIGSFPQIYGQDVLQDFSGLDHHNQIFSMHHGLPHAYAIGNGPTSHQSPSTDASPGASGIGFEGSPTTANFTPNATPHMTAAQRSAKRQETKSAASKFGPASVLGKRSRDPSSIYDTVHEPYSYTTGFHNLTAFLQRRFSATKTLRIAKSLASIRPSFISCTKTLNRQDLIFMEKCFQRTLFEYEELMLNCCTPTLVCRRTGEIAAVNKEFTLLTGWKKDVLLGREPNLNINTGQGSTDNSDPGSLTNTGRAGLATPRMRPLTLADQQSREGRPQNVFLAELLDDDSVIEFYEDFARLAFGDSRGSVTTRCKMLKYQIKDDIESPERKDEAALQIKRSGPGDVGGLGNRVREIDGEHGIGRLHRDGKLDCTYCWTVKRDVFNIPMLIVMNEEQEPNADRAARPSIIGPDSGPEPPFPLRMGGVVISGFGRGSKELGIPTANLPVDNTPWIATAESGVYFGWASLCLPLDHPSLSPSSSTISSSTPPLLSIPSSAADKGWRVYPMVMSIGFNPFYKNTVRSAEVHLIQQFEKDFYGSEMRLEILGFVRRELDYISVEALIEDIRMDIEVAKRSLEREQWRRVNEEWLWGEKS
ncbi:transcription factor [Diplocarpon rosae]|nr:transcription factor [Diplocarpon rosae]